MSTSTPRGWQPENVWETLMQTAYIKYDQGMGHRSHYVFCVAHIEATDAKKGHCICLGGKGDVNLRYSPLVSICAHSSA